jgi:hypothetical protein
MSTDTPRPSTGERLKEVYRRLDLLPRADSAEGALRQICEVLEQVEDELSGIPKQVPPPPPGAADQRMYCPLDDFVLRREDGSMLALTRGHRLEIAADGALRVVNKVTKLVEFEK